MMSQLKIGSWESVLFSFPYCNSSLWNVMFKWQHYSYEELDKQFKKKKEKK